MSAVSAVSAVSTVLLMVSAEGLKGGVGEGGWADGEAGGEGAPAGSGRLQRGPEMGCSQHWIAGQRLADFVNLLQ